MIYWIAILMGLVEGLTEFIPVSSTGHLILTGHLVRFTGPVAETFEIFIQLGAMLAVVVAYPRRFTGLLRFREHAGFSGGRGIGLLLLTTLPALVLGAVAHGAIKRHLFTPTTVAIGLGVGALWILWIERRPRPTPCAALETLTWKEALGIGLFQCLALWPGMSRSASTILGGMMLGVERRAATEYSFLAAVPVLTAAGCFDLYQSLPLLQAGDLPLFAVGFGVAFAAGWLAVKGFVRFLGRHTLQPFAWYRLALAAAIMMWDGM